MKMISYIFKFITFYFILLFTGCNAQLITDVHYEKTKRIISFQKNDRIDISNLSIQAYWKDSLLFSSPVNFDKKTKLCYIDAFPNKQIAGLLCKKSLSLMTDICYHIGKDKELPIRYTLINNNHEHNVVLFDTIIALSNILDKSSTERVKRTDKVPNPQINFNGTGYHEFQIIDYYNLLKEKLYTKGIINLSDDILKDAAYYLDILLNEGYLKLIIPQNATFSTQTQKSLSIHIPDSIPKVYLLLTSLSGWKSANDFSFNIDTEISNFIAKEYTKGFPQATTNNNKCIDIPIHKVGNHKYNFVQLLVIAYILKNNDYLINPIGYTLTYDKNEVNNFIKEDFLFKTIVSPLRWHIIGDYYINYYANTQLLQQQ